jgi:hypothetical protein
MVCSRAEQYLDEPPCRGQRRPAHEDLGYAGNRERIAYRCPASPLFPLLVRQSLEAQPHAVCSNHTPEKIYRLILFSVRHGSSLADERHRRQLWFGKAEPFFHCTFKNSAGLRFDLDLALRSCLYEFKCPAAQTILQVERGARMFYIPDTKWLIVLPINHIHNHGGI